MPEYSDLKTRQRAMWAMGDYDRIAAGLHVAGEHVVRAARIRPGARVLDVACGTGNTAIKARTRGAVVTGIDFAPELLTRARMNAQAEGFEDIDFREGDAENLAFPDQSFDVVVSSCGHMFAPDQSKVAAEFARVLRVGGLLCVHAWTPDGGVGRMLGIIGKYAPPPPGLPSPFNWGDLDKVTALLGGGFRDIAFERGDCPEFGSSPEDILDLYATKYGPMIRAFAGVDPPAAATFRKELIAYYDGYRAADGKVRWGREYLITKAIRA